MPTTIAPEQIVDMISEYVSEHPDAVVIEDGHMLFDFAAARYTATPERDRCLLQMWSEERNIVRRVTDAQIKNGTLRLTVSRFGQAKPGRIEICAKGERQTPSALKAMRAAFQRKLERVLERQFPGWTIEKLVTTGDLEHSFGPAHTRGVLRRGTSRIALVGCGAGEAQSTVDAAASIAVLWLACCRERASREVHYEGAALFVPRGRGLIARARLSHLNQDAARWRMFEVDEDAETSEELELSSELNLSTRLVQCPNRSHTLERFSTSFQRVRAVCRRVEAVVSSTSEVSFRYHGVEFARAVMEADQHFRVAERIFFGAAPAEYELTEETEPLFQQLVARLEQKRGGRDRTHTFYRLQPERWLESIVKQDVSLLDARLDPTTVYEQVPAFAAGDRAMIDLLAVTRDGRLAVIELKADEDLHLPMQGLDYWARVRWHHRRGDFQKNGYFPGRVLSEQDPILILAAPALRVHPTIGTLLHYLSPAVEWKMVGLDERWRDGIRVIFTKSKQDLA